MSIQNDPSLIQISIAALAKMIKFDISHPGKETAGLLLGREEEGIVYVEDVRLGDQKGNAVHVVVSDTELTQAAIEVSERTDGQVIVGWIHTHPNLSAFLSATDIKTQTNYQALMPNAIAIVIDPVKYSKSQDLNDLDLKVFRVSHGNPREFRYTITKSVEFGLNTFVHGNYEIKQEVVDPANVVYTVNIPNPKTLLNIRENIENKGNELGDMDKMALISWIELFEAINDGAIKEVPVDVERMMNNLDNTIGDIEENLLDIKNELEYRKNIWTTLLIIFGVALEFLIFGLYLF